MVPTVKLLFDRCIEVGDCRLWQQGVNGEGVPIISLSAKERSRSVRRIAYRLIFGDIPSGKFVYVECANKLCISEKCMKAGTKSDYMKAASKAGAYSNPIRDSQRAATARKRSHLTLEAVRKIRRDRQAGVLLRELASEHNVSMDVVSKIARNQLWREHAHNASVFNQAA